jgi:hypothetical protein
MTIDGQSGSDDVQYVSLEGDPEEIALQLLAPSLWRVPLEQIDLSTQEGQASLLTRFIAMHAKASLEKDEIIRFTERNRASLPFIMDDFLPKLAEAARSSEDGENLARAIEYFLPQVRHAYAGEYDKIDVKSDRLLWLVYVLGQHLAGGKIGYDDAVARLRKPVNRQRISPLSLNFMLVDFSSNRHQ